eukprot:scaffold20747_cov20-Tisochrysis_lutea.AAC.1
MPLASGLDWKPVSIGSPKSLSADPCAPAGSKGGLHLNAFVGVLVRARVQIPVRPAGTKGKASGGAASGSGEGSSDDDDLGMGMSALD